MTTPNFWTLKTARGCDVNIERRLLTVLTAIVVAGCLATGLLPGRALAQAAAARETLEYCNVSLITEAVVPARQAGALKAIEAVEGMHVEAGQILGQINDDQAQVAKKVAEAELAVAHEQATNDINVRYAAAQTDVARKTLEINEEANRQIPRSKPEMVIQQLKLEVRRAELGTEQAAMEQKIAGITAEAKATQVNAAEVDIEYRRIVAPIGGEVVEVTPHVGEWVNPGDPVLRIVQLDRLRVTGNLELSRVSHGDVINRPVTIEVVMTGGRVETFAGKITFADPLVAIGGSYQVFAEVENRRDVTGQWLLHPGVQATMIIDLRPPVLGQRSFQR